MTLRERLIDHEQEVLHLYYDSLGVPSIGIGINLRVGRIPPAIARQITITPEASRALFELRLADCFADVERALPWARGELNESRFEVLVEMAYNLGIGGLLAFKRALAAIRAGDWPGAKAHMLDSKWRTDVGARADRLAEIMLTGVV